MAESEERGLGTGAKLGIMPSRLPQEGMPSRRPQEGIPGRCPQEGMPHRHPQEGMPGRLPQERMPGKRPQEVPPVEMQPAVEERQREPQASSEEEGGGRENAVLRDCEGEVHSPPFSPPGELGGAGAELGACRPELDEADDELDGAPVIRADDGEEEEEEEEDWDMGMRESQDCAMETNGRTDMLSDKPGGECSKLQSEGAQTGTGLGTALSSGDVQCRPLADVEMSIVEESAGDRRSQATPFPATTEPSLDGGPPVARQPGEEPPEALCISQEFEMGAAQGACVIPPVDIKDEPIDEEYDQALTSQPPPRRIKDEPDTSEELVQQHKTPEELTISSVFSVGDNSTSPTGGPAALPLTPVSRMSAPPPRTMRMSTPPAPPPARSTTPPSAVRVSCSGCTKVLQKGQTAFQRKGSSQLFCSTVCLTGCNLPPTAPKPGHRKTCHYCLKEIGNPKDVIIAPVDMTGTVKDFCSQACLSSFDFKRNSRIANEDAAIKCSMCKKSAVINHEVNYQGAVHKLCSDSCFSRFRSSNNLTMNCCETCGAYCCSATGQCHLLQMEGATKKFCSQSCLTTYKQKCIKVTACSACQSLRSVAEMVEGSGPDGKIQLYCSAACANHSTPRSSIAGTSFPCTSCRVLAVPQFHLALNDGSIRNFCSYNCVVNFQAVFSKSLPQGQVNGTSAASEVLSVAPSGVPQTPQASGTLPLLSAPLHGHTQPRAPATVLPPPYVAAPALLPAYTPGPALAPPSPAARVYGPALPTILPRGPTPAQASPTAAHNPAPQSRGLVKLSCRQCHQHFYFKPELLQYKGQMGVFCGKTCSEEYRRLNFGTTRCEYCKLDKMVRDVIKFNHQDRPFCSEGCKLLFKHDLAKRSGSHCRTCAYCTNMAQKMIQNHFGGKLEEFCREECMSLYTVLYYQMAKCDWCQRQGKLLESQKWLGEMKHFCDLPCLLQFSSQNSSQEPQHSQLSASGASSLPPQIPTGAAPACIAPFPHPAGVQSTTTPFHTYVSKEATPVIANVVSLASAPTGQPSITANTALQGAVPTALTQAKINGDASTQTDAMKPPAPPRRVLKNKALLCKPISQNKGTLCKPHTHSAESQTDEVMGQKIVVLPVPVPVFIPVPMHLYSQYTPLPLGLPVPLPVPMFVPASLNSAELMTRTIQGTAPLQGKHSIAEEEEEEEERDKPVSYGDQGSTYSGDLESEGVSTPHSGEEEMAPSSQRLAAPDREESPVTLATPPLLDLEEDFPLESLGTASVKNLSMASRFRGRRRPRDGFPPRKRGRKRAAAVVASGVARGAIPPVGSSKLLHKYGVNAWKSWVQSEQKPKHMALREDVLQCSSVELSVGLCRFIKEVRRPNGDPYTPDSLFYLCLGLQQYLFENGRIENLFTDQLYSGFTVEITRMLRDWERPLLPNGLMLSRVEEEYLWECKQLGAYSPIVLLNTLLFFSTKLFHLKTLPEHRRLSFTYLTRCTRPGPHTKSTYLRFCTPPKHQPASEIVLPAKRRLEEEDDEEEEVMEMPENTENPLRCPVRLYEFYLSKCPDSVRQRTDLFYLQPEHTCMPNSRLWYSSLPLESSVLENMLIRILAVQEVHLQAPPAARPSSNAEDSE